MISELGDWPKVYYSMSGATLIFDRPKKKKEIKDKSQEVLYKNLKDGLFDLNIDNNLNEDVTESDLLGLNDFEYDPYADA